METTTTFTVRDLNRQPAKVLKACDRLGSVRIRTRTGKSYSLTLESAEPKIGPLPDFAARRKKIHDLGLRPLTQAEQKRFHSWLRGEE